MFEDVYKNRRVLITGHTGFKGSWLCQWLLELGAKVSGVALAPQTDPALFSLLNLEPEIEHNVLDIRDSSKLNEVFAQFNPEIVFHLAAQPLVRQSYDDPIETWSTNVMGTVNVLEAVRSCSSVKSCVVISSDKCYENNEQVWGYRENDPMGGHDPYSASKGATELIASSYRNSFFNGETTCQMASARAGNVIGGGDWAKDRIVVDFVSSIAQGETLALRNPLATRPWQHVLEPLGGYLCLGSKLFLEGSKFAGGWNFGPNDESVVTVDELAKRLVHEWGSGKVEHMGSHNQPHEAGLLKLDCSKARAFLNWHAVWDIDDTAKHTVSWYKKWNLENDVKGITLEQISEYINCGQSQGLAWAK